MWEIIDNSIMIGSGATLFYVCFWLLYVLDEKKEWRYKLIYPNLFIMALLVNPWVCQYILQRILGYGLPRLNMCFPVGFIIAYSLTTLLCKQKGRAFAGAAVGILLLLLLCNDNMLGDLKINTNWYGLPQDVIETSDIVLEEKETPLLLTSDPDFNYFRQYSSSIRLLYGENTTTGKMQGTIYHDIPHDFFVLSAYMESEIIDWSLICPIASQYDVDYIVINSSLHTITEPADNDEYQYWQTVGIYDLYKQ